LLFKLIPGYQPTKFYRAKQHTLLAVLAIMALRQVKPPLEWPEHKPIISALDVFIGYFMLDAWIGNQDRHHENWALIVSPAQTLHLSPTYDHASSLGRNETDNNRRDRLTTRDRQRSVERYVERAASAFYESSTAEKPMSTLEAFSRAMRRSPKAAEFWIERLSRVSTDETRALFDRIPRHLISEVAAQFAQKMLELNRLRLLNLRNDVP
jgi:hypothetical protein